MTHSWQLTACCAAPATACRLMLLPEQRVFHSFPPVPKWRNWQTRMVQVHVPARVWGFESLLRHQVFPCTSSSYRGPSLTLRISPAGSDARKSAQVLGPWSPVPKCEAPGAPISVEELTSMAPRPKSESSASKIFRHSGITVAFRYHV